MSKNKGHRVRPIQAAFVRTLVYTSVGTNAMLARTENAFQPFSLLTASLTLGGTRSALIWPCHGPLSRCSSCP